MPKKEPVAVQQPTVKTVKFDSRSTVKDMEAAFGDANNIRFSFSDMTLNQKSCDRLAELIKDRKTNTELVFENVTFIDKYSQMKKILESIHKSTVVSALTISGAPDRLIDDECVISMGRLIKDNKLSKLSLTGIECEKNISYGSIGFGNITLSLEQNNSITTLELDLSDLSLSPARKKELFSILGARSTTCNVSLGPDMLNFDGSCERVVDLLKANKLSSLTLKSNSYGNIEALKLAHVLASTTGLGKVDIHFKSIDESGKKALYSAMKHNSTLQDICISEEAAKESVSVGDIIEKASAPAAAPQKAVTLENIIAKVEAASKLQPSCDKLEAKVSSSSGDKANSVVAVSNPKLSPPGHKQKLLIALAIKNAKLLVEKGAAIEDVVGKIETVFYHDREILQKDPSLYTDIADLYYSQKNVEDANQYYLKSTFWQFVNQIKTFNDIATNQSSDPVKRIIIDEAFQSIDLKEKISDCLEEVFAILHCNPKIIEMLQATDNSAAKFFTAMGRHDMALSLYPENYGQPHAIAIHDPVFVEFLQGEQQQCGGCTYPVQILGDDHACEVSFVE